MGRLERANLIQTLAETAFLRGLSAETVKDVARHAKESQGQAGWHGH